MDFEDYINHILYDDIHKSYGVDEMMSHSPEDKLSKMDCIFDYKIFYENDDTFPIGSFTANPNCPPIVPNDYTQVSVKTMIRDNDLPLHMQKRSILLDMSGLPLSTTTLQEKQLYKEKLQIFENLIRNALQVGIVTIDACKDLKKADEAIWHCVLNDIDLRLFLLEKPCKYRNKIHIKLPV